MPKDFFDVITNYNPLGDITNLAFKKFQVDMEQDKLNLVKEKAERENTEATRMITARSAFKDYLVKAGPQVDPRAALIKSIELGATDPEKALEALLKPQSQVNPLFTKINPKDYTPESVRAFMGSAGAGAPDYDLLKKVEVEGKNRTEEQLTSDALKGDKQAQSILDSMEQRKVRIAKAGTGGFEKMEQSDKDVWFEQYAKTNKVPPFAWRDSASRDAFTKGYADYLKRQGITPTEAIVNKVENDALTGSLKLQERNFGMMGSFVNNLDAQIGKVDQMMQDTISRVGIRAIDIPIREFKTRFAGSGQERVLESYLMEISREIGKLSTGSQASIAELSVEAQKKWDKIHDPNLSFKDLSQVLQATRDQAQLRKKGALDEINVTKKRMLSIGAPKEQGRTVEGDQGEQKQNAAQQYNEGQTATNPKTGKKLIFKGGSWQETQ